MHLLYIYSLKVIHAWSRFYQVEIQCVPLLESGSMPYTDCRQSCVNMKTSKNENITSSSIVADKSQNAQVYENYLDEYSNITVKCLVDVFHAHLQIVCTIFCFWTHHTLFLFSSRWSPYFCIVIFSTYSKAWFLISVEMSWQLCLKFGMFVIPF